MPALFKNVSSLLRELSTTQSNDEGDVSTLDFNPDLAAEMEKLSQITEAELAREFNIYQPVSLRDITN